MTKREVKNSILKSLALLAFAVLFLICADVFGVGNPVGPGTVPPSSRRSGLVRSRNPIDTSSNLVVTGNISGNRYFRGVVPYRATSDFGGSLGSGTLDSFLRRSSGSGDMGRYTGSFRPYYSQTRTVTRILPGGSRALRPPSASVSNRPTDSYGLGPLPKMPAPGATIKSLSYKAPRPMSLSRREMERLLSKQAKRDEEKSRLTTEEYRQQREQFLSHLKEVQEKATELKEQLTGPQLNVKPQERAGRQIEIDVKEQQQKGTVSGVYEQMKKQIFSNEQEGITTSELQELQEGFDAEEQAKKIAEISARAAEVKKILGKHKTFASLADDKFNRYMRAGEEYLKEGRYYRAADAYSLASVYKPSDPLAYAGKGHALFAAGEYISAALFLSKTIEIFPEYVQFKVDIVAMIGDKDKVESRISDIKEWYDRSDAAELQFLLAYIYYQMDRLDAAKEAIEKAYEKMADVGAVAALKQAIDSVED
ncbi:MAG: tetratricopeptide repeat protein [Planctomycetota bacterium]|jgi:tetratricopeptide (TPR) repeat protein